MAATLKDLESRVQALETETRELRTMLANGKQNITRLSWADAWTRLQEELGIKGEPVGAERLQDIISACGFPPEENALSREIIAMREE